MRRLIVALGLGLTAAAGVGFGGAVTAYAQQDPGDPIPGTMQLSTEVAAPGEDVTATSVSPCHPEGDVEWRVFKFSGGLNLLEGTAQADAEGHWSVVFAAVEQGAPRGDDYRFEAECTIADGPVHTYFADFEVRAATGPEPGPDPEPGPEPEPAAPASPVQVEPDFAG
jgi:hypothetical protein